MSIGEIIGATIGIIFAFGPPILIFIGHFLEMFEYNQKRKKWDREHPEYQRIRCINCKHSKKETSWAGRYPNGTPERHAVYCRIARRNVSDRQFCIIAEPLPEMIVKKESVAPTPTSHPVYFSPHGDYYHSTPDCNKLKTCSSVYCGFTDGRRYCHSCWQEKDGKLYPK